MRILLIVTGHTIEPVRSQYGNTDSHFGALLENKAQLVPYFLCDGAQEPHLSEFDGVIMTGSASMLADNEPWMETGRKLITQCLSDKLPFLGVCFGHQMLGNVCGAKIGPNPNGRRNGTSTVNVIKEARPFTDLPITFHAQVSHRDVILEDRPEFQVIATAMHDPRHAIQVGESAFGVQFHPEWTVNISGAYIDAREQALGKVVANEMRNTLQPSPFAKLVVRRFLDLCQSR